MNEAAQRNWKEILFNRRMLTCIFLGFTSGMPLYVLFQLVPAWLRSSGVDLSTIGLFALVSLPYTWKFLWSPLMDRYKPPFLGRRRGWTLITQLGLLATIGLLGHFDPGESLQAIVWLVFTVALFSAVAGFGFAVEGLAGWFLRADQGENGGIEVESVDHNLGVHPGLDARAGDDERHPCAAFHERYLAAVERVVIRDDLVRHPLHAPVVRGE